MSYPTQVGCTLCPHRFDVPLANSMHLLKTRVYEHLKRKHGLTGRPRNLEADRIASVARVPL